MEFGEPSVPGGIRTPNLLIRSQKLYPVELQAQFFKIPSSKFQIPKPRAWNFGAGIWNLQFAKLGWPTGLEPATTRTTIWGSTIELRPPTITQNKILRFESPFANPVSVGCKVGRWFFSHFAVGRAKGQRRRGF